MYYQSFDLIFVFIFVCINILVDCIESSEFPITVESTHWPLDMEVISTAYSLLKEHLMNLVYSVFTLWTKSMRCSCEIALRWMSQNKHLWRWINIGSGNGLVPSDTKPLPEPMLPQNLSHHMASVLGHHMITRAQEVKQKPKKHHFIAQFRDFSRKPAQFLHIAKFSPEFTGKYNQQTVIRNDPQGTQLFKLWITWNGKQEMVIILYSSRIYA